MKRVVMGTLAVALALGMPVWATAQTSYGTASSKAGASADQKFITDAARGNMAEVELGRLASERGSSAAVKQFGQRMVTDHGEANQELAQVAQQKGLLLPSDVDAKHERMVARLSKLSGSEFDQAYSRAMDRDHRADVKEFQHEAKSGKDAEVRAWATKTLPVLEEHQQMAHQLAASTAPPATATDAAPASSNKSPYPSWK